PVPLTRIACAHALLHRLGLRGPLAVEAVSLWARLPANEHRGAAARRTTAEAEAEAEPPARAGGTSFGPRRSLSW
ncbi:MAG TPA: hypothetical protein VHE35_19825, partial [Kofleriaceae bacterium]|nr:hypothetical protein [Kofleriaceae bacterium]